MIGVYGGSFDPFTKGHADIVRRALTLLDELHIVIGVNIQKRPFMTPEQRLESIRTLYRSDPRVHVTVHDGILARYAQEVGAKVLIRGLRNASDFEVERPISEVNRLKFGVETLFLMADPELSLVSSSLVRELATFGESYDEYLPDEAAPNDIV